MLYLNMIRKLLVPGAMALLILGVLFERIRGDDTLIGKDAPYLVNWPDRRPIARMFIAGGDDSSASNPRGYFKNPALDVSNQAAFNAQVLDWADHCIKDLNAMNPKPQGILIWDLEGEEFHQPFTYVGNPPELPDLAPEMDAVADKMFAKFREAGYKIGLTLRSSTFMTGTKLPATGNYNEDINLTDIFIKLDAPYPYRGYICTAPNTWTQPGARFPNCQTLSDDDSVPLGILKTKVDYARKRWGATMFYVDTTVYSTGAPLNPDIFRQLQKDFPDCLFFPEEKTSLTWGATAPYGQANQGDFGPSHFVRDIYPGAFSVLQVSDGIDYADPSLHDALVNSVKKGNILFVDGWQNSPANASILQIYRDAGKGNPAVPK